MNWSWDFLWKSEPDDADRAVERGLKAEDLWKSTAFESAIHKVRQGIHERWASAPLADTQGQHELRLMLKLLNDVEGNIRKEMNDGIAAKYKLDKEKEARERQSNIRELRR